MEQERHTGEMISLEEHEIAMAALRAENEQLRHAATHDALTGLLNYGAFIELVREQKEARKPFGVLRGDLDEFRQINNLARDHGVGDTVLKALGGHLQDNFSRSHDRVTARLGGDEFAVFADLSDGTGRRAGHPYDRMDDMCAHFDDTMLVFPDVVRALPDDEVPPEVKALPFRFSRGAAVYLPSDEPITLWQFLTSADVRMYTQKMSQVPVRTPEEAAELRAYERGLRRMGIPPDSFPKHLAALHWRERRNEGGAELKDPAALRAA